MEIDSESIVISSDESEDVETQELAGEPQSQAEPLFPDISNTPSFVINSLHLYLTYPHCSVSKETVLLNIGARLKPKYAIVSRELHKDGTPHLHAVIVMKKRQRIRAEVLDALTGKHGNYQSARNLHKVISYVVKDNEFVAFGINVASYLAKRARHKSTKRKLCDTVAAKIREGSSLEDIDDLLPGYFMMNKRKIQDYATWVSLKRQRESKLKWLGIPIGTRYAFVEEQTREVSNI